MVRPEILGILHNTGFSVAETSALASGLRQVEVVEAVTRPSVCHKREPSTLFLCTGYCKVRFECTFHLLNGREPRVWLSSLVAGGLEETV